MLVNLCHEPAGNLRHLLETARKLKKLSQNLTTKIGPCAFDLSSSKCQIMSF